MVNEKRRNIKEINDDIYRDLKCRREQEDRLVLASDRRIQHIKRFWEEMPKKPTHRNLNAALLKKDFLILIERLEFEQQQVRDLRERLTAAGLSQANQQTP